MSIQTHVEHRHSLEIPRHVSDTRPDVSYYLFLTYFGLDKCQTHKTHRKFEGNNFESNNVQKESSVICPSSHQI